MIFAKLCEDTHPVFAGQRCRVPTAFFFLIIQILSFTKFH